jgi:hypothetical protein
MRQRWITHADVVACLGSPVVSKIETSRKVQYKALVRGRMLKVGVAPDRDTDADRLVTTVMWEDEDG